MERRASPRRRVLKGGTISFHQLGTSTDCVVRNVSDGGACLSVASTVGVPRTFRLIIGDHSIRPCRVIWHTADRLGVAFQDRGQAPGSG